MERHFDFYRHFGAVHFRTGVGFFWTHVHEDSMSTHIPRNRRRYVELSELIDHTLERIELLGPHHPASESERALLRGYVLRQCLLARKVPMSSLL